MSEALRRLVEKAAEALSAAPAWAVGGLVRDRELGVEPRDADLLVEGDPSEPAPLLRALREASGMDPVVFDRRPPATYRVASGGAILDASLVAPGTIEPELRRRDFSVNAIAVPLREFLAAGPTGPLPAGSFLDPCGGLADLRRGVLRLAGPAALEDDPLRMLRAVRLLATIPSLAPDRSLEEAIAATAHRATEPAAERLLAELEGILASPRAAQALRRMERYHLLAPLLPELAPLRGLAQPSRHHDHDAFEHTLRAVEEADSLAAGWPEAGIPGPEAPGPLVLKWAALLHDTGKAATATVDGDGIPHFHGHEEVSAGLAAAALARLRAPGRTVETVTALVRMHLRPLALASPPAADRPVRRLIRAAGERLLLLLLLALADRRASGGAEAAAREAALLDLARRCLALRAQVPPASAPPLVDGREVMSRLGIPPGPRVGSILRWLDRLRTEGAIATREEALAKLRSLPPSRIADP